MYLYQILFQIRKSFMEAFLMSQQDYGKDCFSCIHCHVLYLYFKLERTSTKDNPKSKWPSILTDHNHQSPRKWRSNEWSSFFAKRRKKKESEKNEKEEKSEEKISVNIRIRFKLYLLIPTDFFVNSSIQMVTLELRGKGVIQLKVSKLSEKDKSYILKRTLIA